MVNIHDAAPITSARKDAFGALQLSAFIGRSGCQTYSHSEVGLPGVGTVRVLRPEAEVFASASLATLRNAYVTVDHPDRGRLAKDAAVGSIVGDAARDGSHIRASLRITGREAIAQIQAGRKGLSAGYTCDVIHDAGLSDQHGAWDAYQANIRYDHVSLVWNPRCGATCSLVTDSAGRSGGPTCTCNQGELRMDDDREAQRAAHVAALMAEDGEHKRLYREWITSQQRKKVLATPGSVATTAGDAVADPYEAYCQNLSQSWQGARA